MPYIEEQDREDLEPRVKELARWIDSAGELNYVITCLLLAYIGKDKHYDIYNEVVGVLDCVKLELYRRVIAPYEDKKRDENGEVYQRKNNGKH